MSKAKNKKNIVIYTAIFGEKDELQEPTFIPQNCDFVCFSDQDFQTNTWQIRKQKPPLPDPVRCARKYKVLAHRYLSDYEYSIWVDGNILVRGDVNKLLRKYLIDCNMAVYNHMNTRFRPNVGRKRRILDFIFRNYPDLNNCAYKEADKLIAMAARGKYKDDPEIIKKQMRQYEADGFPKDKGLLHSCIMLRRHGADDVARTMEAWWQEIKKFSRRDQLSFNYVAWKNNFKFCYLRGVSWNNKYFRHQEHKIKKSYQAV